MPVLLGEEPGVRSGHGAAAPWAEAGWVDGGASSRTSLLAVCFLGVLHLLAVPVPFCAAGICAWWSTLSRFSRPIPHLFNPWRGTDFPRHSWGQVTYRPRDESQRAHDPSGLRVCHSNVSRSLTASSLTFPSADGEPFARLLPMAPSHDVDYRPIKGLMRRVHGYG